MEEKNYYSVKAVSNSSLKWFEMSPLYFKMKLDKEIEEETKSYFEIGKKIHMKLLEPKRFEETYLYLDYTIPKSEQQKKFCEDYAALPGRSVKDKALQAYKNNYSNTASDEFLLEKALEMKEKLHNYIMYLSKRNEFKDILSYTDNKLLNEVTDVVKKHKKASELLYISDEIKLTKDIVEANELEVYFKHPVYNIDCKSAIDRLIINHTDKIITLVDIKTTAKLSQFSESFKEYKYYRQFAFYWTAIWYYLKNTLGLTNEEIDSYKKETFVIAIQKSLPGVLSPVECKVFTVTEEKMHDGLVEIESILTKLEWHFSNDLWEYSKDYYEGNGIEKL